MRRPMTLGQIIDTLKRKDENEQVVYDFVHFRPTTLDSWRGVYDYLALGYTNEYPGETTVAKLLGDCESAIGKTFYGYKGGEYVMDRDTPVYVANNGEAGSTAIVDIIDGTYIVLVTECVDP